MKDAERVTEGARVLADAVNVSFDTLRAKYGPEVSDVALLGLAERLANTSFHAVANGGFLFMLEGEGEAPDLLRDPAAIAREVADEIESQQKVVGD